MSLKQLFKNNIALGWCIVIFMHFLYVPFSFSQQSSESSQFSDSSSVQLPPSAGIDTLSSLPDSLSADSLSSDTTTRKPFLDDMMNGQGKDSMVYDIKSNKLYIYNKGEIKYIDKQMNADYFEMKMSENVILAKGMPVPDSVGVTSKAKYVEGDQSYDLDSIVYNINSEKAKIYGIAFKEGEGVLLGRDIKKMDNGIFNIAGGKYTTCDAENPHFYLALTKAQYVDTEKGKKVIVGPSYLVIEDVPLPLFVPFGFFPMTQKRSSGLILPDVGEDGSKGFYLRGLGYYVPFGEYLDLAVTAGIYTYGSWEASAASAYKVRYKFSGGFNIDYSKDITGDKGSEDYQNMNNYRVTWRHSQDPKFRPGTTISANVNWSSSNYNKYDATDLDDYVSSQTNSSVSFSKTWIGTPFSFSANLQHSQNNRDSTVMLSMPNTVFSVSRFMPFERKDRIGKEKWYEKISMSYTNTFNNSVTTKENELFSEKMFKDLKYGMKHTVPVSTSFNLFKYFNVSPSVNYTERWYFDRINKEWDPETQSIVAADTSSGFYRVYNYNVSASMSTMLYGSYNFKGKDPIIKAMRHVLSPSISGSWAPDFSDAKYGFYKTIQSNAQGDVTTYSPYSNGIYGVPGTGRTGSLSFSLGNTLEAKFRNRKDSTGFKKISLIESLSISSSYNFLADSLKLAPFSVGFRTTLFKSLGINVSSTWDPYAIDENGRKINTFNIKETGKLARLTSLGFSFGYSFRSVFGLEGGTGSASIPTTSDTQRNMFDNEGMNYAEQQRLLAGAYYDFSIPWNLSFNYNFSYSKSGWTPNLTQTVSFNGGLTLTKNFGITFSSGYDFEAMKLTTGSVGLTRDLHCWQFSFSWVPVGFRKSWNFTIRAKSSMLSDLKYEKNNSYTDNMTSYY